MLNVQPTCCVETERMIIRALWEVVRRHNYPLELNATLREHLEAQIETWRTEDAEQAS